MWICPQCAYHNEEWDEACAKCGAAKPAPAPATSAVSAPPPSVQDDPTCIVAQPTAAPTARKRKRVDPVVTLVSLLVCFMLIILGLVGYIAWQRGMVSLPWLAASQPAGEDAIATDEEAGLDAVALDPLLDLAGSRERAAKPYKTFAKQLLDSRALLTSLSAPAPGEGDRLSAEQQAFLDQLNRVGQTLLAQYKEFETQADQNDVLEAAPNQDTLAAEFTNQFERLVQLIGQVYGSNTSSSHDAYLLPDLIKAVVAPGRRISLTKIAEEWSAALEARMQRKLDLQNPEEIKQLTARLEALKEVHRTFKAQLDALPPYDVMAGNLNKAGQDALNLLDSLMTAVEGLAQEQQQYIETLKDIELSQRMELLETEFTKLAQDDHFFCFSEVCRLSVDDRKLEHPAYAALRQHYEFVNQNWSSLAIEYLKVFDDSERDWRMKWGTDPSSGHPVSQ
jgi:hypothetical protein